MKILFLGGDRRQLAIIDDLGKKHLIDVVGYNNIELTDDIKKVCLEKLDISFYDVIIFPVNGVQDNYLLKASFSNEPLFLNPSFLEKAKANVLIFTGIRTQCLDTMLNLAHKKVIPLMEDNDVKKENSVPTTEGIIGDLIYNTPHTINGSKVLILGYGDVGKLLTEKLMSLDANVTVGVILPNDFETLMAKKINTFYTSNQVAFLKAIHEANVIVNTVPSLLLDKHYLDAIDNNTYILDISSYPHGVDFNYATEKGLNNKLFLGIPSVIAPETSGLILSKKIKHVIGGEQ